MIHYLFKCRSWSKTCETCMGKSNEFDHSSLMIKYATMSTDYGWSEKVVSTILSNPSTDPLTIPNTICASMVQNNLELFLKYSSFKSVVSKLSCALFSGRMWFVEYFKEWRDTPILPYYVDEYLLPVVESFIKDWWEDEIKVFF